MKRIAISLATTILAMMCLTAAARTSAPGTTARLTDHEVRYVLKDLEPMEAQSCGAARPQTAIFRSDMNLSASVTCRCVFCGACPPLTCFPGGTLAECCWFFVCV